MKLEAFFSSVAPFLRGEGAADALGGVDVKRWKLYGDFCEVHRRSILDGLYPVTKRRVSTETWERLFRDYFIEHPCRDWDLNANGEAFAAFLAARDDVEPWVAELADLEWWMWSAFIAVEEPGEGPLNPVFVARPYAHDVLRVLDGEEPVRQPTVALVWRTRDMRERTAAATQADLVVLKCVVEGVSLSDAAEASGIALATLEEARRALEEAEILVGEMGT